VTAGANTMRSASDGEPPDGASVMSRRASSGLLGRGERRAARPLEPLARALRVGDRTAAATRSCRRRARRARRGRGPAEDVEQCRRAPRGPRLDDEVARR
jgi:hypothetical protein